MHFEYFHPVKPGHFPPFIALRVFFIYYWCLLVCFVYVSTIYHGQIAHKHCCHSRRWHCCEAMINLVFSDAILPHFRQKFISLPILNIGGKHQRSKTFVGPEEFNWWFGKIKKRCILHHCFIVQYEGRRPPKTFFVLRFFLCNTYMYMRL